MQAIEKLKGNRYNLLLMDIRMPEIDGIEATKYIRNAIKNKGSRNADYMYLGCIGK